MDKTPSEQIADFLNFVDSCMSEYQLSYSIVNEEDRKVQDFLHEMEFAEDKGERNRIATKLQKSRRYRRENKDIVKRDELVVKFFEEQSNRATLNRMRQLLGKQRKEEEYLQGERIYKPRVERS